MTMLTPLGRGGPSRRRRRNQAIRHAIVLMLALIMLVAAGVTAWWFTFRPTTSVAALPVCPTPTVTSYPPVATIPAKSIKVNVYNSTSRQGLAARVAADLRTRGFAITSVANDPLHKMIIAPAEIRYGPAGEKAAQTLALQVQGAVAAPDNRKSATVDLVLGMGFTALRTPAEVKAAAAPGGTSSTAKPASPTATTGSASSAGSTAAAAAAGGQPTASAGATCVPVPTVTITAPGFLPSPTPKTTTTKPTGSKSP